MSVASSNSRLSTGSSVVSAASGASVKWDEQGLETVCEQRRKEREERRMSEDSVASVERAERGSKFEFVDWPSPGTAKPRMKRMILREKMTMEGKEGLVMMILRMIGRIRWYWVWSRKGYVAFSI